MIKDIVFSTNNNFCKYIAVALMSLLDNNTTADLRIHLLCIDVADDNYAMVREVCNEYGATLYRYNINSSIFTSFRNPGNYSVATYSRLMSASLLPKDIEAVLYLDGDIVVNGDISELLSTDIRNYAGAAVHDTTLSYRIIKDYATYDFKSEGYYNAGVFLFNLSYWRSNDIERKFFNYLSQGYAKLNDQDAINEVLHGKVLSLPPKWNCHAGYFAFPPLVPSHQKKYIKTLWRGAVITHFTGPAKPWHRECVNPYKDNFRLYMKKCNVVNPEESLELHSVIKIVLRHIKSFVALLNSYRY